MTLRKFPYPYKAAFTICSDIDETGSIEEFVEIQEFLNSADSTALGTGLGLDIGNSFWFYNQDYQSKRDSSKALSDTPASGISLFSGISDTLNTYSSVLLRLIKKGRIDCLHTYGEFKEGGFSRSLALRAIELWKKESLKVDIFINHGDDDNRQNFGEAPQFMGDNVGSVAYHADITIPMGIKFIWRGQVTHCIGQDAEFSVVSGIKQIYEYLQNIFHPDQLYHHDNQLAHPYRLDDGQRVFEFVRYINPWGKYSSASEPFLSKQIGPTQINKLIGNGGYMIHYTHLGKNDGESYLSPPSIETLRYIKGRYNAGELLVTTTSKMLNYYVHHKYLYWRQQTKADTINILIDSVANEVEGRFVPEPDDLAGLSFYVPDGKQISVKISGRSIKFVANKRDFSDRISVSIPLQEYRPFKASEYFE